VQCLDHKGEKRQHEEHRARKILEHSAAQRTGVLWIILDPLQPCHQIRRRGRIARHAPAEPTCGTLSHFLAGWRQGKQGKEHRCRKDVKPKRSHMGSPSAPQPFCGQISRPEKQRAQRPRHLATDGKLLIEKLCKPSRQRHL
jgi:hypothetical protein